MIRVLLDADTLFSAAYREGNGILRLWELPEVHPVTSPYALEEAERNIARKRPAAAERLRRITSEGQSASRPMLCAKLMACRQKTPRSSRQRSLLVAPCC